MLSEQFTSNEPVLIRLKEASSRLGIGSRKLLQLADAGEIKAIKLGDGKTSPWYFSQLDLDSWIERRLAGGKA
jgi:excisionase family DNA binding protein